MQGCNSIYLTRGCAWGGGGGGGIGKFVEVVFEAFVRILDHSRLILLIDTHASRAFFIGSCTTCNWNCWGG